MANESVPSEDALAKLPREELIRRLREAGAREAALADAASRNIPRDFPFDDEDCAMISCLMHVEPMRKLREVLNNLPASTSAFLSEHGRLLRIEVAARATMEASGDEMDPALEALWDTLK